MKTSPPSWNHSPCQGFAKDCRKIGPLRKCSRLNRLTCSTLPTIGEILQHRPNCRESRSSTIRTSVGAIESVKLIPRVSDAKNLQQFAMCLVVSETERHGGIHQAMGHIRKISLGDTDEKNKDQKPLNIIQNHCLK